MAGIIGVLPRIFLDSYEFSISPMANKARPT